MTTKKAAELLGLKQITVQKWCKLNLEKQQFGSRLEYDVLPEHIEIMRKIVPGTGKHGKGGKRNEKY